jgi:hypothetical protein
LRLLEADGIRWGTLAIALCMCRERSSDAKNPSGGKYREAEVRFFALQSL